jgi:hypothetical protein
MGKLRIVVSAILFIMLIVIIGYAVTILFPGNNPEIANSIPDVINKEKNWLSIIWNWAAAIIIISSILSLPFLIGTMAENNDIFTNVKEGEGRAIMGAGDGGFIKFIWQHKGWTINENYDVVPAHGYKEVKLSKELNDNTYMVERDENVVLQKTAKEQFAELFGLTGVRLLGIPGLHTLHKYTFRWNSLRQSADENTKENGGIYFTPHEEVISHFILQTDSYYIRLEGAEDGDMIPLSLDIVLQLRITNPFKALFAVQEWLESVFGEMIPTLRRFTAGQKWEVLVKDMKKAANEYMEDLNKSDNSVTNIEKRFGIRIEKFNFLRISAAGASADVYEEYATRRFKAEKDAEVLWIGAKAEAKKIKKLAKAEQNRITTTYGAVEKQKELGKLIRSIEGLERAASGQGSVIFDGSILNGFKDLLKKAA